MNEEEYIRIVKTWLYQSFADVEYWPRLDSGRLPDFIAHTPFESYVIEVEDSEDSLYTGIGQAAVYALETGHKGVAIFPADSGVTPGKYGEVEVITV